MNNIILTVGLVCCFVSVILLCEVIHRRLNVNPEFTRKIAHSASTLFSLSFLFFFESYWNVALLGGLFFFILFLAKRYRVFKSIDNVQRKTAGSYLLPIAISLTFIISKEFNRSVLFVLPILILGISDPIAGITGVLFEAKAKKIRFRQIDFGKTFLGSAMFWVSTFVISFVALNYFLDNLWVTILYAFLISVLSTMVEIVSSRGLDNITVPLVVSGILYFI